MHMYNNGQSLESKQKNWDLLINVGSITVQQCKVFRRITEKQQIFSLKSMDLD